MKPRRRVAVELGKKLRHPMGGALANTHRLDPAAHTASDAAEPASWPSVEEPKNLRPSVALRTMEERPRSAVREPEQREPNRKPDVAELNDGLSHIGRDRACGPQTRDFDTRQVVSKQAHNRLCFPRHPGSVK
jgi:hypothetical protein